MRLLSALHSILLWLFAFVVAALKFARWAALSTILSPRLRRAVPCAFAFIFALAVICLLSDATIAQDGSGASAVTVSTTSLIISALLAALPGIWSLFVAYAAKSEATWDDWVVSRVRDVARAVVKEEQSSLSASSNVPAAAVAPAKTA